MQSKTVTTLNQLRIGDSFVYINRADPWRVIAREDRKGRVAVNQVKPGTRELAWKHDELIKGNKPVMFLRHTIPVAGEEIMVDDLVEGDVFFMPDDIIHEYILVKQGHHFCDTRRSDHSYISGKIGRLMKVIFIRHKEG